MAGIPKRVLEHFAAVPLFARVSKKGLRAIATAADEFDVPAGRDVVGEGELGHHLFVIVSGTVKVTRKGRKVATMGPGDFFGEMALVSRAPRNATVTTESDATLMSLGAREFSGLLAREPSVAQDVMAAMADRIRSAEKSIAH